MRRAFSFLATISTKNTFCKRSFQFLSLKETYFSKLKKNDPQFLLKLTCLPNTSASCLISSKIPLFPHPSSLPSQFFTFLFKILIFFHSKSRLKLEILKKSKLKKLFYRINIEKKSQSETKLSILSKVELSLMSGKIGLLDSTSNWKIWNFCLLGWKRWKKSYVKKISHWIELDPWI